MPISMNWSDQNESVAYSQFVGHWNMKQFHNAWDRAQEMLVSRRGLRVDFVLDISQSILIPPDFVRQFRQLAHVRSANVGVLVFIGADEHLRLLVETLLRVVNCQLDVFYVDNMDEAQALILRERQRELALIA